MIKIESTGLRALRDELAAMPVNVTKEMRIAAWHAQKTGRAKVATQLATVIKQPAKRLKGASYAKMLPDDNGFVFIVREKFRIALKRFKPSHTKAGVVVGVLKSEKGKSRRVYGKGFLGGKPGKKSAKLNGAPMERTGEKRKPLRTIPAIRIVDEVRSVTGMVQSLGALLREEFRANVVKRIRFLKLKLAGKLRNQKQ
jgi:hypothetical protein